MSNSECPTFLIEDKPSEIDSLAKHGDFGPHSRVATAIASLIKNPKETGGKVIGLEGGWGSGKTTVIRLLSKQLGEDGGSCLYIFDAWAHEGDPLRRSFLESLVKHFVATGWLNDDKALQKRMARLAKRQKSHKIVTKSHATVLGRLFAVAVLLVPIGSVLLSGPASRGLRFHPSLSFSLQVTLGLIFVFAPFIVLGGNLFRRPKHEDSDHDEVPSKWAFVAGETTSTITQDSIETPDPTSLEFESEFQHIMAKCLPAEKHRKVIVVIDNLDRINPGDALKIWSTLQTFLPDQLADSEPWYDKVWIIVPYDPHGLAGLWNSSRALENSADGSNDQQVSESFIDKRMQIRFEVPPPILSNWKEFLLDLLSEALPAHEPSEFLAVYRVYNRCRQNEKIPTPRELKLFTNQVGAIHRQWQHDFPLEHIAYYVVLKRRNMSVGDIAEKLLDGTIPEENVRAIKPEQFKENIAGLAFNLPTHLGQQILLAAPILASLVENNTTEVAELIQKHPLGFWPVLEESVGEGLKDLAPASLGKVALCLKSPELNPHLERNEIRSLIDELYQACMSIDVWAPLDRDLAEGLASLVETVGKEKLGTSILNATRDNFSKVVKASNGKPLVLEGLELLTRKVTEKYPQSWPSHPYIVPGTSKEWLADCQFLSETSAPDQFLSHISPECGSEELELAFRELIGEGRAQHSTITALRITQRCNIEFSGESLIEPIKVQLQYQNNASGEQALSLLELLGQLRGAEPQQVDTAYEYLVNQGHLAHSLHHKESQQLPKYVGWFMAVYASVRPDFSSGANVANAQQGYSVMNTLLGNENDEASQTTVEALILLGQQDLVWQVDTDRRNAGHFLSVLRTATDKNLIAFLAPSHILANWEDLQENLPEDKNQNRFDELIASLTKSAQLDKEVMDSQQFSVENAGLYWAILCIDADIKKFQNWCAIGLRNLSSEEWQDEITQFTNTLDIVCKLQESGLELKVGLNLHDAMSEFARRVIDGTIVPADDIGVYIEPLILAIDDKDNQSILRDRIIENAIKSEGSCSDKYFEAFATQLSDVSRLISFDDVPAGLFAELVRAKSDAGLDWLANIAKKHPDLLGKFKRKPGVTHFKQRIRENLAAASEIEQITEHIEIIAKKWKIRPSNPPKKKRASKK